MPLHLHDRQRRRLDDLARSPGTQRGFAFETKARQEQARRVFVCRALVALTALPERGMRPR